MNTLILRLRVRTFLVLSAAVFGLALPGLGQTAAAPYRNPDDTENLSRNGVS